MSVDTKYGEAIFKQTQEVAEMFKAAMPKITTNKNGYEIRTKVLEMAQNQAWQDYHAKFAGYETTVTKEGDNVVGTKATTELTSNTFRDLGTSNPPWINNDTIGTRAGFDQVFVQNNSNSRNNVDKYFGPGSVNVPLPEDMI